MRSSQMMSLVREGYKRKQIALEFLPADLVKLINSNSARGYQRQ